MRHLSFAATLALSLASICLSSSAGAETPTYSPRAMAAVTPGNYLLRLRVASLNGAPVQARLVRAVPVVIGIRGATLGVGGKYGPQITGSLVSGTLSASGPTPGKHGVLTMAGGAGGAQGRFSVTQADGSSVSGEYLLDPVAPGILGQTLTGVGSTSGFTNMTPVPQSPSSVGGKTAGLGETPPSGSGHYGTGNTGPHAGQFGSGSSGSAPGMAGEGPNLGGTSLSGWASEDKSPTTKINPKTAGGPNATSGAGTSPAPPPKEPGVFGTPKPAPAPPPAPDSPGADCAFFGFFCSPPPAKPDGGGGGGAKEGNPMDDGSHNAGTAGSGLNKPGAGNDKGGGSTSGGTNGANGATVNRPTHGGDNPFEVTPADVLNTNHLINFASDPVPGVGGAQTKGTTH